VEYHYSVPNPIRFPFLFRGERKLDELLHGDWVIREELEIESVLAGGGVPRSVSEEVTDNTALSLTLKPSTIWTEVLDVSKKQTVDLLDPNPEVVTIETRCFMTTVEMSGTTCPMHITWSPSLHKVAHYSIDHFLAFTTLGVVFSAVADDSQSDVFTDICFHNVLMALDDSQTSPVFHDWTDV